MKDVCLGLACHASAVSSARLSKPVTCFLQHTSSKLSISNLSPLSLSIYPPPHCASRGNGHCLLTISPSTLVVRFGDPVTANCSTSTSKTPVPVLGWEGIMDTSAISMMGFKVWSVDRMTKWDLAPMCFISLEMGGQCYKTLSMIVYKPPDHVSISFVNHTGPMFENRTYTLQCAVQKVAPIEKLTVTYYRGQTALAQQQSSDKDKTPVSQSFTVNIIPSREDNGEQYWCEAKLELGPEGPQPPPVVASQKLDVSVLFGPNLHCPTKLQVREGQSITCEVRGNPRPSVTWFRDGQMVILPTHSSREDAGTYTMLTKGLEQKTFTVEVEVLEGNDQAGRRTRWRQRRSFIVRLKVEKLNRWKLKLVELSNSCCEELLGNSGRLLWSQRLVSKEIQKRVRAAEQ
ncbi:hypothetical protein INR49_016183, partial [Caranx melampygus]